MVSPKVGCWTEVILPGSKLPQHLLHLDFLLSHASLRSTAQSRYAADLATIRPHRLLPDRRPTRQNLRPGRCTLLDVGGVSMGTFGVAGNDRPTTSFSSEDGSRGPCASTDRDRQLRLL